IEDHPMPFAGFDVYRIERNDAQALPGAFAGVVSEIDAAGDAIVAVGSTLGPVFAPAPAAPWRVINPAGCADSALVVARWVGGRPDWLRCIVRTGTVGAGPMQVNPDGDIVAIFELHAGATVAFDKTRYAAEGGERFVLVRIDGATGAVTWSLEPAG